MNREIKFRAWDRDNEMFVYAEPIYGFFPSLGMRQETVDGFTNTFMPIQQYTGLKDKNGKEIYEGDIVKFNNSYSDRGFITWNNSDEFKQHEGFITSYGAKFVDVEIVDPDIKDYKGNDKHVLGKKVGVVCFGDADLRGMEYGCLINGWYIKAIMIDECKYVNESAPQTISEVYDICEIIGNIYENPELIK